MLRYDTLYGGILVPLAGIEPALLAEPDFVSGASTNSATGAGGRIIVRNGVGSTLCVAIPTPCGKHRGMHGTPAGPGGLWRAITRT